MAKSVSELLKFRQLQGADLDPRPGALQEDFPQSPSIGSRFALTMNVVPHFSNHGYASAAHRKSFNYISYWSNARNTIFQVVPERDTHDIDDQTHQRTVTTSQTYYRNYKKIRILHSNHEKFVSQIIQTAIFKNSGDRNILTCN